jgi:hydrogenase maturation protease
MTGRTLVAGIGNVFLGDDGFGVEVVRRLARLEGLPEGVEVADFGIRGVHLAYEMLEGWDTVVLVDALPRGEAPGTLSVLEVEPAAGGEGEGAEEPGPGAPAFDAHRMDPAAVLWLVERFGGKVGRTVVVGCEPEVLSEGMELSGSVAAAVDAAVGLVRDLVSDGTEGAVRAAAREGEREATGPPGGPTSHKEDVP